MIFGCRWAPVRSQVDLFKSCGRGAEGQIGHERVHRHAAEQNRQLPDKVRRRVTFAHGLHVRHDMVERLEQDDGQKQHDARDDEGLAEIIAVFVVHRQKRQVEQPHQHEPEAEKGQIRLDADGIVDLRVAPAEEHERDTGRDLQQLQRHDGRKPRPDHIPLRDRQQGHVIHVPVLPRGLQHEENAEGIIEKRHVIRIARHEHQRAQQQKQQRHRPRGCYSPESG